MNTITINGKTITTNATNVSVRNGKVFADGKLITETDANQIVIQGDVQNIDTDLSVNVSGTIHGDVKAGGSVNCDDVKGSVQAGGSVNCDDVGGSVHAKGSVNWDGK